MTRIKFMNTEIDNLTMNEALQAIDTLIQQNKNAYVVTPNIDHIVQLEAGGEICEIYKNADLILTDGNRCCGLLSGMVLQLKKKYLAQIFFHFFVKWQQKKVIRCFFWVQQKE